MKLSAGTKETNDLDAADSRTKLRLVTQPPAQRNRFTIGVCEQVFAADKRTHQKDTRTGEQESRFATEPERRESRASRVRPQILVICVAAGLFLLGYLVGRRK